MRIRLGRLGSIIALALIGAPAYAAPALPAQTQQAQTAYVPFEPPIGEPLQYRSERIVEKDGVTVMTWEVASYRFDKSGDGYRLTVSPVSYGSNEKDPNKLAIMKKLESLTNLPFVLRLGADGSILELENADTYWSGIIKALKDQFGEMAKPGDAAAASIFRNVVSIYESMPADVRLAQLTESVQPLLEFGGTEMSIGQPLSTAVETQSPFGGTIKQEVVISLAKVTDTAAFLVIQASVPRSELDLLMKSFTNRMGSGLPAAETAKMRDGLAALKDFKHETRSEFRVSLEDGMLEEMLSTETTEARDAKGANRRITTRSMKRVP